LRSFLQDFDYTASAIHAHAVTSFETHGGIAATNDGWNPQLAGDDGRMG